MSAFIFLRSLISAATIPGMGREFFDRERPSITFDRDGAHRIIVDAGSEETPFLSFLLRTIDTEDPGRTLVERRDFNASERDGQACSDSLEICFFAGPKMKEGAIMMFACAQMQRFGFGKKTLGEALGRFHWAHDFYIDAEFALVTDGCNDERSGVREIEKNRWILDARERWLAVFSIFKLYV